MATGLFLLNEQNAASIAALTDRVAKLETEVAAAGGDSTLSAQVTSLRTDFTSLQGVVGAPDGPASSPAA